MSPETLHDDLGELRQLASRIFQTISDGAKPPDTTDWTCEGIYWDIANRFARHWPDEKAAEMLAAWRFELDGQQA